MDRCALFVDAGYVLADGAMAVHGTRRRVSVSWDHAGLLKLLAGLARDRTGLPVLRCYWYETAEDRTSEHDALAEMPGLKLRLINTRPGRREGIESRLRRDIVTLAKSGAIADAFIASADERLAEIVAEVQDLGLRVVILHITSDGCWTIPQPLRQECDDIVEISGVHLRPFVDLIRGAEPTAPHEQYASSGDGSRSGSNGDGSRVGANSQSAVPVAALPAAVGDYPARVGSHYRSTRPESRADVAPQGSTAPYMDSRSADEAAARQAGGTPGRDAPQGTTQAGTTQAGTAPVGTAQAGSLQVGMPQGTSGRVGTGQVGSDQAGVEQFVQGPFGNGRLDSERHSTGQTPATEFGAVRTGTGHFGAGAAQFGAQAGPEQFGAGQGRPGQLGAQAGPEQFGAGQGREGQLGAQAGPEQFGASQAGAEQFGPGPYGSGQFGNGHNGAVRQPGSPAQPASPAQAASGERGGQQHSGGAESGRGTGQLAAAAQAGQQLGDPGQHAQPPQHAATSTTSVHQGSHGLGGPRHEYGVSQEVRASQPVAGAGMPGPVQEPLTPQRAPLGAPQHAAYGMAQHESSAMPQHAGHGGAPQRAPSGAQPGGSGYSGIAPDPGHDRVARDGAGYGTGAAEPAGGFRGGLGLSGAAQTAGHGDAGNQDRVARGIHAQASPYQNGQAAGGAAGGYQNGGSAFGYQDAGPGQAGSGQSLPDGGRAPHLSGLTSYQGNYGGYQSGSGQNGSADNAVPGFPDGQGRGGYALLGPYQPGSTPNGGSSNGGPRDGEASRPPSAGFVAAPTPIQPQPYSAPDHGYFPGQPGGLTQGPSVPGSDPFARNGHQTAQPLGSGPQPQGSTPFGQYQQAPGAPAVRPAQPVAVSLSDAVKTAHSEGYDFGESVGRAAPGLWLEAVLARKPRMPSDLEARLLQGSSLPIDSLLHDDVRHSLRRGFWDALESVRR